MHTDRSPSADGHSSDKLNGRAESYVRSALESIFADLANDREHYNNHLNEQSFAAGNICSGAASEGTPVMSSEDIARRLFEAATLSGYVQRERDGGKRARATIKSALDAGLESPRDLRAALSRGDSRSTPRKPAGIRAPVGRGASEEGFDATAQRKVENARRIWDEAQPIDPKDEASAAVAYMRARIGDDAVTRLLPDAVKNLRFHSACPVGDGAPKRDKYPALIGRLVDTMTGKPTGAIQRIFLRPDGTSKADLDPPRQGLGSYGDNGAVVLGKLEPGATFYEVEGIEKGLAVKACFPNSAVIAVLGVGRFGKMALSEDCKRIIVGDAKNEADRTKAREAAQKRADTDERLVGLAFPGAGFGDTDDHCRAEGVDGPDGVLAALENVEWLSPLPAAAKSKQEADDPEPWPRLGEEALTGLAGDIVRAATEESEADPAAVLVTFLTMAGIAIGRGPFIKIADDYHHARLFSAIVGASARGRKGTSEGPVRRVWGAAAEKLGHPVGTLKWKPGPMSSGEGLIFQISDGELDENGEGDPGTDDKRLLVVEGEFGAALRSLKRESNTLSAILRSAWDGRTIQPLTKSSRVTATDPHIGVVAHITEIELKSLLSNVEIFNGFANRFLWVCARRSRLLPLAAGMKDELIELYGSILADHVATSREFGRIEFSAEARRRYQDLYTTELSVDEAGVYGTVVQRAEVQVVRLALTYALLDVSQVIEVRHLGAALAVWRYCNASAKRIFDGAGQNPLEHRVIQALMHGPLATRELHQALGGHVESGALRDALRTLEGKGNLDSASTRTSGRPRITWSLRSGFEGANKASKDEQRDADR